MTQFHLGSFPISYCSQNSDLERFELHRLLEEFQLNGFSYKSLVLGVSKIWSIKESQQLESHSFLFLFDRCVLFFLPSLPLIIYIEPY